MATNSGSVRRAAPGSSRVTSEQWVGRILMLLWATMVSTFWTGEIVAALAGSTVAGIVAIAIVSLTAYALWHWERNSARVVVVLTTVWTIAFPIIVYLGGGENIAAVAIMNFVFFVLPGLVAAGLIFHAERKRSALLLPGA